MLRGLCILLGIGAFVAAGMWAACRAQEVGLTTVNEKSPNVAKIQVDPKTGVYRVWITLDEKSAMIAKFRKAPSELDVQAVRAKALAEKAASQAAADAEAAKTAQAEVWKSEGKCPCCGQALPAPKEE